MIRVGQKFQEERTRQGISLEQASKATKIRVAFLTAIEKGEYNKLPSGSYAVGFVKNYSEFLNLPKRETLALFRREYDATKSFKVLPEGFARKKDFPLQKIKIQQTAIVVLTILCLLGAYLAIQYRYTFINPPLSIASPLENSVGNSQTITITGKTDPNAAVYVNNDLASVNAKGDFQKTITLFEGKSTIKVRAVNRFNKETVLERHVEIKLRS